VRHAHQGSRLTTSVCTGSLVLAAADRRIILSRVIEYAKRRR